MSSSSTVSEAVASKFASIALGHVTRPWPYKADHVMDGEADVVAPRVLHPIFFGSFDWHSCVHGYWTLATLLRLHPNIPQAPAIRALFNDAFTAAKVETERAYLDRPLSRGFERPYGWAWLLMLAAELDRHDAPWGATLKPLALAFADRFKAFLPKATYPIRVGTHFNTAFALTLTLEWAEGNDAALAALCRDTAQGWYGQDVDCQAWEPSGDEFLSSALMEAECMRRILPADAFKAWFAAFLPRVAQQQPATLFTPAFISDRSDGKIAHLDGLNLSRAWCWRGIARTLDGDAKAAALEAADRHMTDALPHVAGDYMGEHWLATFALLAMLAE
ncbi:DUF2891 domain-containing protein [Caulobacter segnis]|uniref:DUF2891 domain-containing protein n=1 Tax=Caulobacter segnis TaxID=88688 RepID=UPI00240EDC5D|nr:DUF2891 domain-containing protein [Caulobacter segnis]MDG2523237.1 DUF2891 domain-containing protein [Caulobacter segnis]